MLDLKPELLRRLPERRGEIEALKNNTEARLWMDKFLAAAGFPDEIEADTFDEYALRLFDEVLKSPKSDYRPSQPETLSIHVDGESDQDSLDDLGSKLDADGDDLDTEEQPLKPAPNTTPEKLASKGRGRPSAKPPSRKIGIFDVLENIDVPDETEEDVSDMLLSVRMQQKGQKHPELQMNRRKHLRHLTPMLKLFYGDQRFLVEPIKDGFSVRYVDRVSKVLIRFRKLDIRPEGVRGIFYANQVRDQATWQSLIPEEYHPLKIYQYKDSNAIMVNGMYLVDLVPLLDPNSLLMQHSIKKAQEGSRSAAKNMNRQLAALEDADRKNKK